MVGTSQAARRSGKTPTLFLSHIAGIFDDYLGQYVREHAVDIAPDVLWQAGLAAARRVYAVVQARGYPCVFVSGGSRPRTRYCRRSRSTSRSGEKNIHQMFT